ncbi:hypothetical protein [Halosimplex carlsbadense]|uniref:hypothetical protein n=1 Tax=Halosimplex carlsbadense TaxID=171164 RepID=UPI0012688DF1|nr:hypothetical protein [Halosimplex carlsbadense]
MVDPDLIEGERGILTEKDRKFLCGELDLSEYNDPENQEYQFRYRIRQRVKRGIKDFTLLLEGLDRSEREKIFEEVSKSHQDVQNHADHYQELPAEELQAPSFLLNGVRDAFQFVFTSLMEATREPPISMVEEELKYALQTDISMYGDEFFYGDVKVSIDDLDEFTIMLDAAAEQLDEELLSKHESIDFQDNTVLSDFVGFIESMPEMAFDDVISLIIALHHTGRLSHTEGDELIRSVTELHEKALKGDLSKSLGIV